VNDTIDELTEPVSGTLTENGLNISALNSNMKKEQFMAAVEKTKDYITRGDAIQVVLSQRFEGRISGKIFPFTETSEA
jgi:anthranilate synthase component 1